MLKQRAGRGARRGRPRVTTRAGTWRSTCSSLLTVSEAVDARGARAQGEPRRPHPRRLSRHRRHAWARSTSSSGAGTGSIDARRRSRCRAMPAELKAALRRRGSDAPTDVTMRVFARRRRAAATFASTRSSRRGGHGRARRHPPHPGHPGAATSPCRWNCKAGKCGSCSAEINGKPRLMCMTRMDTSSRASRSRSRRCGRSRSSRTWSPTSRTTTRRPRQIPPFKPKPPEPTARTGCMQEDVDRVQEFHKCIECFLCQDVCHVIRDHEENKTAFAGPALLHRGSPRSRCTRSTPRTAREFIKAQARASASATSPSAAPRSAPSTSTSPTTRIIPLKERVVDETTTPVVWVLREARRAVTATLDERADSGVA